MGLLDRLLDCCRPHPDTASTGTYSAQPNGDLPTTNGGYDPQLGWGAPHRRPENVDPNRWNNLKSWTEPPATVITELPTPDSPVATAESPTTASATAAWWQRPRGPVLSVWVPYAPPAGVHAADALHHPQPPTPTHAPMYLDDGQLLGWLSTKPSYMRMDEYMTTASRGLRRRIAPEWAAGGTSGNSDSSIEVPEIPFVPAATPRRAQRLSEMPPQSFAGYR